MPKYANISAEMQAITRTAAEPWAPGDSVKSGIDRAARRLGISFRRARTFWYAQTEDVWTRESDTLRSWYRRYCREKANRLDAELAQLRLDLQRLEDM